MGETGGVRIFVVRLLEKAGAGTSKRGPRGWVRAGLHPGLFPLPCC